MRYVTKELHRHLVPDAPPLSFYLPYYTRGLKIFPYSVTTYEETSLYLLPKFFNLVYGSPTVSINGFPLKAADFKYDTFYLVLLAYYEEVEVVVEGKPPTKKIVKKSGPPPIGSKVVLNVSVPTPANDTGWQFLDWSTLLVQGAGVPNKTLQEHYFDQQFGYRMKLEVLSQPKFGQLQESDYGMGLRYKANSGWRGVDSFSYRMVTEQGQKSEPACVSLFVG